MKFLVLIWTVISSFCVSAQNSDSSLFDTKTVYNQLRNAIVIESECISLYCSIRSDTWRTAELLFKTLPLHLTTKLFDTSNHVIKYYAFLKLLASDDQLAFEKLKGSIADTINVYFAFDDQIGTEKFNQLILDEYKDFIKIKYYNGGQVHMGKYYFTSPILNFPAAQRKLWLEKYEILKSLALSNDLTIR